VKNAIIVFARLPIPGEVKTRLAASIGDVAAAGFYKSCAERLFHNLFELQQSAPLHIFCADGDHIAAMKEWIRLPVAFHAQRGEDLGDRMRNAFDDVFAMGAAKAVIVGTDIPELTARHVQQAFLMLDIHDVVIGPAHDGGYYLLAMKRPLDLFSSMEWSTNAVASETRKRVLRGGFTLAQLEELRDVDTAEDYHAFASGAKLP
jgi:rSAM/selenodomain-associated transferase 1